MSNRHNADGQARHVDPHREKRRRLVARLRKERDARVSAELANAEKGRALVAVCHDLRTPLNAVQGWALLALKSGNPAKMEEALVKIDANCRLQSRLISDVLAVARSVSGYLESGTETLDLHDLVEGAISAVEPVARAKGVEVSFDGGRAGDAFVDGDSMRLRQILWNLLTNAIKYSRSGGSVRVRVWSTAFTVHLSVADDGAGIRPELLPRIFDRFAVGGDSASGTGVGLTIVKRLVEMHRGTVAARSDGPEKGATFEVELPLAQTAKRSAYASPACSMTEEICN